MNDNKSIFYIVSIIAVVAIVGLIVMFISARSNVISITAQSSSSNYYSSDSSGQAITANNAISNGNNINNINVNNINVNNINALNNLNSGKIQIASTQQIISALNSNIADKKSGCIASSTITACTSGNFLTITGPVDKSSRIQLHNDITNIKNIISNLKISENDKLNLLNYIDAIEVYPEILSGQNANSLSLANKYLDDIGNHIDGFGVCKCGGVSGLGTCNHGGSWCAGGNINFKQGKGEITLGFTF